MLDVRYLERAVELARLSVEKGGGPFGCVITCGDQVLAEGVNSVTRTNDPTAHAEIVAIREACRRLGSFQLSGCIVYASCEPCPMCLGAMYWARPQAVFYASTRKEAARAGFDDQHIYDEMPLADGERTLRIRRMGVPSHDAPFDAWKKHVARLAY
ncbi:MAG: tRNA-specific adenosine deaminase [Bacteroidetes bacterium CG12_big_fil_rev_8_21_14_0_65_60_17]|nr:MAG: tRNA-specific adenosine deaminase [Bacteroidetes bacterium CG12_big_fil_rev_8_21_14_0_65_60_17]